MLKSQVTGGGQLVNTLPRLWGCRAVGHASIREVEVNLREDSYGLCLLN